MRYDCIRCTSETDNDDDVCDVCKREWREFDVLATARARIEQLEAALSRLGSMEAFTNSFRLPDDTPAALELRARIDFARAAMEK